MMLSKIRKSLYDADDAKFSQDISTAEDRRKKILELRRARLNALYLLLWGFLVSMFSVVLQLMKSLWVRNDSDSVSITFQFAVSVLLITIGSVTYVSNDSQIKMLLLFEKTQPKG